MKKIKRQYVHCNVLEEAPMWGNAKPRDRDLLIDKAFDLLNEPDAFEIACKQVTADWPNSSLQNLSSRGSNRKAWLGWAACYVACNSTEYTTRQAWRMLSEEQKDAANLTVHNVIERWEKCQKSD